MTINLSTEEKEQANSIVEEILNKVWDVPLAVVAEVKSKEIMEMVNMASDKIKGSYWKKLTPEVQNQYLNHFNSMKNLSKFFKGLGYLSAIPTIYESVKNDTTEPIAKYVTTGLVTMGILSLIPVSGFAATAGVMVLCTIGMEALWDSVKDGGNIILEELFKQLGIYIDENGNYVLLISDLEQNIKFVDDGLLKVDLIKDLEILFSTGEETRSPLVVDLDGDGIETIGTDEKVYFDHDDNGFAENTGWVGKDDGLLVRDLNNNGQIDNGTELFGNNSVLSSGEKAANGFEALKELDSNGDNIFNNQDTAWNEVKVWKDTNSNGVVDEGELLTLEQANISGINLDYQKGNTQDENNNSHAQTGTFIKTDGSTGTVTDVWFDKVGYDTVNLTDITIPDNIKNLPDIPFF